MPSNLIIVTVKHGRTRAATKHLKNHLRKTLGQKPRLVALANTPARSDDEAFRLMEVMRDGSNAEIAFHHIAINPQGRLTPERRDETVQLIVQALDAQDHPWLLYEHDEKQRATAAAADHHFHLVLGHVGPDLKALDMRDSYARLEAVARKLELTWGVVALTPTRRHKAVAAAAHRLGWKDVAQAVAAMKPADPADLPRSAMSSRTRARAARHGIDLAKARIQIARAFAKADSGKAVQAALAEHGFSLSRGARENVWVVWQGDVLLGALDRLVHGKRQEIAERLDDIAHGADPAAAAEDAIEPRASDADGQGREAQEGDASPSRRIVPGQANPEDAVSAAEGRPARFEIPAAAACAPGPDRGRRGGGDRDGTQTRVPQRSVRPPQPAVRAREPIERASAEAVRGHRPVPEPRAKAAPEMRQRHALPALAARIVRDMARRTVGRLEAELELLREKAPGGLWARVSGAGRRPQALIDQAKAALAEAETESNAAREAYRAAAASELVGSPASREERDQRHRQQGLQPVHMDRLQRADARPKREHRPDGPTRIWGAPAQKAVPRPDIAQPSDLEEPDFDSNPPSPRL